MTLWCRICRSELPGHSPWCPVTNTHPAKHIAELKAAVERPGSTAARLLGEVMAVTAEGDNAMARIAELEEALGKFRAALEEIADFEPDCDCKTYQYCPCLSCAAKKALGRGMWAEK